MTAVRALVTPDEEREAGAEDGGPIQLVAVLTAAGFAVRSVP
jgi:hypothetical protein